MIKLAEGPFDTGPSALIPEDGMPHDKELVVYTRSTFCPYQAKADRVFARFSLKPRTILINDNRTAEERVVQWTGFKSVPTIIAARPGEDVPYEEPVPLERGASPRGVDRGSMITEASEEQLTAWLARHGFIPSETR
jgi:glutaredoxin